MIQRLRNPRDAPPSIVQLAASESAVAFIFISVGSAYIVMHIQRAKTDSGSDTPLAVASKGLYSQLFRVSIASHRLLFVCVCSRLILRLFGIFWAIFDMIQVAQRSLFKQHFVPGIGV